MRPTSTGTLVAVAVVATACGWAALTVADAFGALPRVPLLASLTLLLLAGCLLFTAVSTRARLRRRPGTRPVHPFVAARLAALAKAGSLGGTLAAGAYAGVALFFLLDLDTAFDRQRAVAAGMAVLGGLAVVATALFLERVLRLPEDEGQDEDDEDEDDRRSPHGGTGPR